MSDGPLPSLEEQRAFWNAWLAEYRSGFSVARGMLEPETSRRVSFVLSALDQLPLRPSDILEVGCGTGFLCEALRDYGKVTGVDLSDRAIESARKSVPDVAFHAGDFLALPLPGCAFDVIVSLETLAFVEDQRAFLARCADLLRPGGRLLLSTHNRFVYERRDDVAPLRPGQFRKWTTASELRRLMPPSLRILSLGSVAPAGHRGVLRLLNSCRLNALSERFGMRETLDRLREHAGLGTTLVLHAEKVTR